MKKKFFILSIFVLLISSGIFFAYEINQDAMNRCLCECGCTEAGWNCMSVCCSYHPEEKASSPACMDTSLGACVCEGFGCGRAPMSTSGDCYDSCMVEHGPPVCGNGNCEYNKEENCANCAVDCACSEGYSCVPEDESAGATGCIFYVSPDTYEGYCENYCIGDMYYYNGEYNAQTGTCAYSGSQQCQFGCSDELGCLEEAPASDNCEYVYCPEYYCEYNTYYYDGYCDSGDGQCYYYSYECDDGCDPATNQCKQPEINTLAPNVEVSVSPSEVVLKDGFNAADIFISVIGSDGPVSGAKVHIRVNDPEFTGVLGSWGFVDVVRYTDASGTTSGKLTLPEINKIKSIYWDEFPCTLEIQVTVSKHDELNDWSVQESSSLGVSSPAPKITDVRIEPSPALAFYTHNVFITIEDSDSTDFTYLVRNYGGKWKAHSNALAGANEKVYAFSSTQTNELIQWESPARGLNKDEIIMARAMAGNLEGLAINLALTGTEEASKKLALKYAGKTFGKYAGNFVPIVNTGKTLYGLYGNVKNLGDDVFGISDSQSFKEGAYRSMDFILEGGKTTIGVVTLAGKQIPVIGGLAGLTQDMIDALVGTMQAKLNDLAGSERIRNAEALTADYAFSIVVKDSDGFRDEYFYEYQMEYLGFKEG